MSLLFPHEDYLLEHERNRGSGKVSTISKWVRNFRVSFISLVKTMNSSIGDSLIRRMWGYNDHEWASSEAQGRSGRILCVWDTNFMNGVEILKGERWIWLKGFFQEIRMEGVIGVIYGYHDNYDKYRLWGELLELKM